MVLISNSVKVRQNISQTFKFPKAVIHSSFFIGICIPTVVTKYLDSEGKLTHMIWGLIPYQNASVLNENRYKLIASAASN
jgi:hypothetical protein